MPSTLTRRLLIVPTPVEGNLLRADLELIDRLSRRYRVEVLTTGVEPKAEGSGGPIYLDLVWLRERLRVLPDARLLYVLRADSPDSAAVLGLCRRYPGVVLLSGGSLLDSYVELHLSRDDRPSFALELGAELGVRAERSMHQLFLGLPMSVLEDEEQFLRQVARASLGVLCREATVLDRLRSLGAANPQELGPSAYEALPNGPEERESADRCFQICVFGESFDSAFLDAVRAAALLLRDRDIPVRLLLAPLRPMTRRVPGEFELREPSWSLLQSSQAVVAVPEAPKSALSSALVTCLKAGAVTICPATRDVSRLAGCVLPLRRFPDSRDELVRLVERLHAEPRLGGFLSRAAGNWAGRFPDPASRARAAEEQLERCQFLRPSALPRLHVWNHVVGICKTHLTEMSLTRIGPELMQPLHDAAADLRSADQEGSA